MQVAASKVWHTGTCRAIGYSRAPPVFTPRHLRRTARCTGLVKLQVCPASVRSRKRTLFLQPCCSTQRALGASRPVQCSTGDSLCSRVRPHLACAFSAQGAGLWQAACRGTAPVTRHRRRYAKCGKKDCWTRCGGAGRGYAAPLLAALSAGECGGPHGGSRLRCRCCCCWWQHWRGHAAPQTRIRTGWRGSGHRWTTLSTTPSALQASCGVEAQLLDVAVPGVPVLPRNQILAKAAMRLSVQLWLLH